MADTTVESSSDDYDFNLVRAVFKSTWDDFYAWELPYCLQTLNSLARKPLDALSSSYDPVHDAPILLSDSRSPDSDNETFIMIDYSDASKPTTSTVSDITVQGGRVDPCAAYEMCTPASRSINVGDDSEYMPFIPLIDDPSFNSLRHAEDYKYFEWQLPFEDPDLEVIVAQTVYSLRYEHRLSYDAIGKTQILPLSVQSPRVLNAARRRDFPKWPIITPLPYLPQYANANAPQNLANLVNDFCSNLNCITGFCTVHLGDMPMPEFVAPTIHSNDLAHSVEAPCGEDCFLLKKPSTLGSVWSESDVDNLTTVLSFSPDLSPCNLAVICRKPCYEVFKRRRRMIPDSTFAKTNDKGTKARPVRSSTLRYEDHDSAKFTPNWPCSHPGPCDATSGCPCFVNNAHCERNCRCDRKCIRRPHGCTCAKSRNQKTCGTTRCSCYRAHRECDPDICIKCEARFAMRLVFVTCSSTVIETEYLYFGSEDPESGMCKNVSIQRGVSKRTYVKKGKWGFGLYVIEDVKEADFILEYTGELLYEVTTICRDFVSRHRGRNYLFQLNGTISIDSTKAGNESRFINHDTNPNCHASVRLVNGEHRIGIFALCPIPRGTELQLNYGDLFFEDDKSSSSDSAPTVVESTSVKPPPIPDLSQEQALYSLDQHSSDETYEMNLKGEQGSEPESIA